MESTFESKIGKVSLPSEKIYNFISDFNNLKNHIPADKISNWESTADSCHFTVSGMGNVGLRIIEKKPYDLLKVAGDGMNNKFNLWIQLKEAAENDTRVKVTIKTDVNPMMKMMIAKPVQKFLDMLVDSFEKMSFSNL
ncbi:MAG: SRPBCC family protein [Bacteroidetes bacterium]|nr:SRPBCC family protein [Bacteroidota bacterium]